MAAEPTEIAIKPLAPAHTNVMHLTGGGPLSASLNWLSYLGAADAGALKRLVQANDGTLITVGSAQDPKDPTTIDLVVGKVAADGSEAIVLYINPSEASGTTSTGAGVAVDAQGVVYIVGTTDANGSPNMVAARVAADLSGVDWVVTMNDPGAVDAGNAIALDATGGTLFLAGSFDHSATGGHAQDLTVARLTDLANPTPTLDRLHSFVFSAGASTGMEMFVDSLGRLDLAGSYQYSATDIGPAALQVDPSLSRATAVYYSFPGMSNTMRGIALGQDGNIYLTGQVESSHVYDLMLAKFNSNFDRQIWGWDQQSANGAVWGEGIQADQAGFPYVTGSDGNAVLMAKFDTSGFLIRDGLDLEGNAVNDAGKGIFLDTANNAYIVGVAASDDLSTPGVFQPTYGGGTSDGLIAKFENLA
jgi:hypothetical protein